MEHDFEIPLSPTHMEIEQEKRDMDRLVVDLEKSVEWAASKKKLLQYKELLGRIQEVGLMQREHWLSPDDALARIEQLIRESGL